MVMSSAKVIKYLTIAGGIIIALAILVLTLITVRHYQQQQVFANKLDCQVNWCQAQIFQINKRYKIKLNYPMKRTYFLTSFAFPLDKLNNKTVKVKGVIKNNIFYLTSFR